MEKEFITIKYQRYLVIDRRIINYSPKAGDVYAELKVVKPHRGQIFYAVDEIFVGMKEKQLTGLAFLDEAIKSFPQEREYSHKLRPDRELNQGDIERKIQEKSPCCNRTMRMVACAGGLRPRRFCRNCNSEVE